MKKITLIMSATVLTSFATLPIETISSSLPNIKHDILVHHKRIKKPILIDVKKPVKEKKNEVTKTDTQAS